MFTASYPAILIREKDGVVSRAIPRYPRSFDGR
jgi:hypothetical protein